MMRHALASMALPWALWAHLETVIERFESYADCTKAAEWAESQADLREQFIVDEKGQRWRSTMTYDCRQSAEPSR